jgi:hypothetical protein
MQIATIPSSIKQRRRQHQPISFESHSTEKMPRFSFFCLIAIVYIAACQGEETYDVKYDNVDVDEILKSERLLTNYIKCLMDEGPCTEDGRDLKDTLPDAINTDCSKCTEKQKEGSAKIMHFM